MRRIRLVIADRRPVVLQGFASLFAAESDFEVVASCLDGASCLEAVRTLAPDVVLVDDGFSDVTASEMLAVANAENLPTRLVFYTASVARGDLAAAIAAGACNAISMRAKPETVLQSLRLVAPRPDRGPAENGAFGEDVLAVLTVEERKIMRLVAYGLSNKEIARQLDVPPGTIKADLDRIFQKLQINNRRQLAALALSRLSSGIGALAALIFAALDDVHAAHPNAFGHTFTDTFTVMAADGTAEVGTIVINPKKSAGASSTTARTMSKAGRAENSAAGTPTPTGKLVDSSADITARTMWAAPNSPRPSSGSYGAFMMAAAAVLIYELDVICSPAQAFDLAKNLTDVFGSATANGTKELVTLNRPSSADTNLDGFDNLAWQNPGIYDRSFAFETSRSNSIAVNGDESQIVGAEAREDSGSRHGKDSSLHAKSDDAIDRSDTIYEGSAPVNVRAGDATDHGGFGESATDASQHAVHGTTPPGAGDDSNRGQSQRGLHASENGSAAAKQQAKHDAHAKHDAPREDSNHGQSNRDLHASEGGSAAAKQHAKHDAPGDDSNHGQSNRDLHASEDGSVAAEQHAKHGASPLNVTNPGQSQRDLHTAPVNASNNPHSESIQNGGGKNQVSIDDAGHAETAAAPELGDSFHFKNEMAASKASDIFEVHVRHEPDSITLSQHAAGHDGPAPIQDAALIDISLAQENAIDDARGAEHHFTHDLIV
ncbi:response regulator transcription factor [Bradyrhizobium sp. BRP22]|uniref:response regulator transcription factor n=1 Tax=Bradyrhizobium sp. BRP22 TaxID=2793821 RepID=UPI001CD70AEB|nr:response regulator transcription factor [Bradyrhizobium sp. BRP22]MCA1457384.1 response regulator transcription factor [Bradyrhizobium sp. BRP22]